MFFSFLGAREYFVLERGLGSRWAVAYTKSSAVKNWRVDSHPLCAQPRPNSFILLCTCLYLGICFSAAVPVSSAVLVKAFLILFFLFFVCFFSSATYSQSSVSSARRRLSEQHNGRAAVVCYGVEQTNQKPFGRKSVWWNARAEGFVKEKNTALQTDDEKNKRN